MWTPIAFVAICFLTCIPIILFLERRRLRRVTAAFLDQRDITSDAEFIQAFSAHQFPEEQILHARNVMAELCGIQPDLISPDDTVRSLLDLQFDNGFIDDFVYLFDDDLDVERIVFQTDDNWSFQQFIVFVLSSNHKPQLIGDTHSEQ